MIDNVICFASAKGGAGKTVMTANIASFLSAIGKKCLVIDCDAATHGMTLLYLVEVSANRDPSRQGIFDLHSVPLEVISSELSWRDFEAGVVTVENGVDFLPATYNFEEGFDPEITFSPKIFREIVINAAYEYDVVLLDAQAGTDKFSRLAMNKTVSETVVIVSEYDPLSAAGVERLKRVMGEDLDYTRTWILLNKVLPEYAESFSEFLSIAKYLPPIPWNADVVRSFAQRSLAIDVESGNIFTLSILKTVGMLFGKSTSHEISKWSENRSFALRAPLDEQYVIAEKELINLLEMKKRDKLELRRQKMKHVYAPKFVTLVCLIVLPFLVIGIADIQVSIQSFLNWIFGTSNTVGSKLTERFSTLVVVTGIMGSTLALISLLYESRVESLQLSAADELRYNRKIKVLEDKLEKLEVLRSASMEEIIKTRDEARNSSV